ncbi:MAG: peptidylprolyl isomerase [Gemmatimonadota bacterium]
MKTRSIAVLAVSFLTLAACDGLKEALTAHVDVVAKANDRELSVDRLSDLLGKSTLQIPVTRETAGLVADLWTGYQLLAIAAARGDSIIDPKLIDEATQGITSSMRLRRFMDGVSSSLQRETASEATYTQATGGLMSARHILFSFPGGATQEQRDSVKKRAQTIRGQVTTGNFADMAKKHSGDTGSGQRGGDLGAFQRAEMVKPFSDAVASLRPGEMSGLVESQFGYHIILRPTYAAAKAQYDATFNETIGQKAESIYVARVDEEAKVSIRSSAAADVKAAARDFSQHRSDRDVLATFKDGSLTMGRFVRWVEMMPPQARIAQQIGESQDSIVRQFVRSITRNEVLLKKADSAGVVLTPEETQQLRGEFKSAMQALWGQLGLDPQSLSDSAKSVPEREKLAADRVEGLLDRVMSGQAQAIQVPTPAHSVLTLMYKTKTMQAGLDRVVERASKLRASADSARLASQPASQVPLPGAAQGSAAAPPADAKTAKTP